MVGARLRPYQVGVPRYRLFRAARPRLQRAEQISLRPDCVRGNDGRYYLYYSLSGRHGRGGYDGGIRVAVGDRPDGKFEYYGYVRHADGSPFQDKIPFDPAVINDGGVIRLYFGTSYFLDEGLKFPTRTLYSYIESKIFHRPRFMFRNGENTGAWHVCLADDMLTVVSEPKRVVPNVTRGTEFAGHAFFEGASIRKFGDLYYFIYSSRSNHELCYATSRRPDGGFRYRGVIVSNGDVGFNGRKRRTALTGNNHGSIERVGERYYIFYHRMADKSTYSRQACAEQITLGADGGIKQVEMTGCGLNGDPLEGRGEYPAAIACNVYRGAMPHVANGKSKRDIPCITRRGGGWCVADIRGGTVVGFKYFRFSGRCRVGLRIRGNFVGRVSLGTQEEGAPLADLSVRASEAEQTVYFPPLPLQGRAALFLRFAGKGRVDLYAIIFTEGK